MPVLRNAKHERFAQELAKGKTQEEAAISAGYKPKWARSQASALVSTNPNIAVRIAEINNRIVEKSTWDAAKVLQRLGEIVDADIAEIYSDDGRLKSIKDWPAYWRRLISRIETEEKSVRSTDGVQAGDSKAWDRTGDLLRKVHTLDRLKALELIGRHKAVDAFLREKAGDVNVLIISAEKARQIVSAKHRLGKAITVLPE